MDLKKFFSQSFILIRVASRFSGSSSNSSLIRFGERLLQGDDPDI